MADTPEDEARRQRIPAYALQRAAVSRTGTSAATWIAV